MNKPSSAAALQLDLNAASSTPGNVVLAASAAVPSFANAFVQRFGKWFCRRCRVEVPTRSLPHRCKGVR